jgi:hypothetical protein
MAGYGPVGRKSSSNCMSEVLESVATGWIFVDEVTIGFGSLDDCRNKSDIALQIKY